jgi:spore photoproduct lyase
MSTEKDFFKKKRTWSKIKDTVIGNYLTPYLKKVAQLRRHIVLVDAFAGPGKYEEDNSPGSPLMICQIAERVVPNTYTAIFVNKDEEHHQKLETLLRGFIDKRAAIPILGTAQELLEELRRLISNQTLFIYLDPFGLKGCDFNLLTPYLERGKAYSTEIVINLSMPTLHRLATPRVVKEGKETTRTIRLNEVLTKALGGEYWKEIMWNASLLPEEKEQRVVKEYEKLLQKFLPFCGSCPVREREEKRVKYYIIFCSRHPDALLLMNDIMCQAYFKKMHEAEYKGTLFEPLDWHTLQERGSIKEVVKGEIKNVPGIKRGDLWLRIASSYFMRWTKGEFINALIEMLDKEITCPTPRKFHNRLNDDCELFLLENDPIAPPPAMRQQNITISWRKYKLLDGEELNLVAKVNDGSIIKRFDKTLPPTRSTNVVCPHFMELKWAYGCPFDCAWCYLKGTFRFLPTKTKPVFKDYKKIELHTRRFLEEVTTPEILNAGEIADSLMGEGLSEPFSKFIIPIFEEQNRHKILFLTKSDNIKHLLEINPNNQAIISFSLNADEVAKKWERGAPSVDRRIEAGRKLSQAGYEVRIRIDPIVPVPDWKIQYTNLIDQIFTSFTPERITLGSLRGLQSTINGSTDRSWLQYLSENSNWGKKVDFKTRYEIYATIINLLKNSYNYHNVALCKETLAMWGRLGMDYKKIKCNCVW